MIEEAIKGASDQLNQTVLGAVLVVSWIALGLVVRALWNEIKSERASHQATREKQLEDLRNLTHVASSLDGLKSSQEKLQSSIVDALMRKAG